MNEILFLLHIIIVGSTTFVMLQMGNQGLCAFLSVQAILANLFVIKQISLFGYNATASDVYIVGSVLCLNLLQEYYGIEEARKALWVSFGLLIFYTIVSQFQIGYTPSPNDFSHNFYNSILSFMPRITAASIVVYLIIQHFDIFFYYLLKKIFTGKLLLLRNICSIALSQFLDTILFSFLGLYGIVQNILQVMIISFIIKICTLLILTPSVLFLLKLAYRNK